MVVLPKCEMLLEATSIIMMAMMVAVMMMVKWIPGNYYKTQLLLASHLPQHMSDFKCSSRGKIPLLPSALRSQREI